MQAEIVSKIDIHAAKYVLGEHEYYINDDQVFYNNWEYLKAAGPEICHSAKIGNERIMVN